VELEYQDQAQVTSINFSGLRVCSAASILLVPSHSACDPVPDSGRSGNLNSIAEWHGAC
jgi:hypothetical protein